MNQSNPIRQPIRTLLTAPLTTSLAPIATPIGEPTHDRPEPSQSSGGRIPLSQRQCQVEILRAAGAYQVVLLQPEGYAHAHALHDVGRLLQHSLATLGIDAPYLLNTMAPDRLNILLGYNFARDISDLPDCPYIIYQLEQLSAREGWFRPSLLPILRGAVAIWDYSPHNIAFLRERGLLAQLLPIGFHERLMSIPSSQGPGPASPNAAQTAMPAASPDATTDADPDAKKDIDILFYGSLNPRRMEILKALAKQCRVEVLFAVYGEARDSFIARSRIVLNLHFYEAQVQEQVMEQARVSYLLNNRAFVVSESSPHDPYDGAVVSVPYDQLVATCLRYLRDPAERQRLAEAGHAALRRRPMAGLLHYLVMPNQTL